MMNTMKKVFMGAVALMMAASMSGCGNSGSGNSGTTTPEAGSTDTAGAVKIGLHYELTGEVADYGKAELNGSLLAIKQANAAAGSEKYGYVNDEEYARAYVRDCLNLKGWGQKRISLELTKRGIDKNIIENSLPKENTEQLELIEKLLRKRRNTLTIWQDVAFCRQIF